LRVAIVSDIHANLAALEAVIADMRNVDAVWCLGDVVGYGPDPVACIDRLRALPSTCIAGNHDWAAIGELDAERFNDLAAESAAWTARQLTADARAYLASLPLRYVCGEYVLAHGSPRDPMSEYLLEADQAAENFTSFGGSACFVGHSHVPLGFSQESVGGSMPLVRAERVRYGGMVELGHRRYILNVGSVGQPRDGDPRARYLVLDTDRRAYQRRRVAYNVARTQERMRIAGLHPFLAARLAYGR
jgi:diadenosine tetraphosphatase ApaH/serine/threonine PP2A family protein phosphatase